MPSSSARILFFCGNVLLRRDARGPASAAGNRRGYGMTRRQVLLARPRPADVGSTRCRGLSNIWIDPDQSTPLAVSCWASRMSSTGARELGRLAHLAPSQYPHPDWRFCYGYFLGLAASSTSPSPGSPTRSCMARPDRAPLQRTGGPRQRRALRGAAAMTRLSPTRPGARTSPPADAKRARKLSREAAFDLREPFSNTGLRSLGIGERLASAHGTSRSCEQIVLIGGGHDLERLFRRPRARLRLRLRRGAGRWPRTSPRGSSANRRNGFIFVFRGSPALHPVLQGLRGLRFDAAPRRPSSSPSSGFEIAAETRLARGGPGWRALIVLFLNTSAYCGGNLLRRAARGAQGRASLRRMPMAFRAGGKFRRITFPTTIAAGVAPPTPTRRCFLFHATAAGCFFSSFPVSSKGLTRSTTPAISATVTFQPPSSPIRSGPVLFSSF